MYFIGTTQLKQYIFHKHGFVMYFIGTAQLKQYIFHKHGFVMYFIGTAKGVAKGKDCDFCKKHNYIYKYCESKQRANIVNQVHQSDSDN